MGRNNTHNNFNVLVNIIMNLVCQEIQLKVKSEKLKNLLAYKIQSIVFRMQQIGIRWMHQVFYKKLKFKTSALVCLLREMNKAKNNFSEHQAQNINHKNSKWKLEK